MSPPRSSDLPSGRPSPPSSLPLQEAQVPHGVHRSGKLALSIRKFPGLADGGPCPRFGSKNFFATLLRTLAPDARRSDGVMAFAHEDAGIRNSARDRQARLRLLRAAGVARLNLSLVSALAQHLADHRERPARRGRRPSTTAPSSRALFGSILPRRFQTLEGTSLQQGRATRSINGRVALVQLASSRRDRLGARAKDPTQIDEHFCADAGGERFLGPSRAQLESKRGAALHVAQARCTSSLAALQARSSKIKLIEGRSPPRLRRCLRSRSARSDDARATHRRGVEGGRHPGRRPTT